MFPCASTYIPLSYTTKLLSAEVSDEITSEAASMRHYALRLVIASVGALHWGSTTKATAQSIGTQCWNAGGMLQCNHQVGVLYQPGLGQQLADYYRGLAQQLAQQRAIRAMQEQAEAQRAQATAAEERAAAENAEREAAAQRLYLQRAESVLRDVMDSLRIHGEGAKRLVEAASPSLADLYRVDPLASQQSILEVLQPHLAALNRGFEAFLVRVVPAAKPAVDSLGLRQDEAQQFTQALLPISQDVFLTNPEATPSEYRSAIQPLLDRARFYFDSTRSAQAKTD
jgi:hypothetical protein